MSVSSLKRCGSMRSSPALVRAPDVDAALAQEGRDARTGSRTGTTSRPARRAGSARSGRTQTQALQAVQAASDETLHVRLDGRHAGLLDELQAGGEARHGEHRRQAQLVAAGVGIEEHPTVIGGSSRAPT